MKWHVGSIAIAGIMATILVGLSIANETRRYTVIMQNEAIASKAAKDLQDLQRLGFLDRDISVQSVSERLQAAKNGLDVAQRKWWMISIKTEENKAKQAKLKRLLSLNRKILKSYRQDLDDMRKFGFPENDPRVVFSRNKIAETVVELAHLTREYKGVVNRREYLSDDQVKLAQRMIDLNEESIETYKTEIEDYFRQGMDTNAKKVREIRSKIAVKLAENSLLERKLHR